MNPRVARCLPPAGLLLRSFTRKSAAGLALALGCVLAGAALSALAPLALKALVDALDKASAPEAYLALAYVACLGGARLAAEARTWLYGRAEQDILRALSLNAVRRALSLPVPAFTARPAGSLIQTLENGLQGYRLLLQHGVFTLLPGVLEIAIIAVILLEVLDAVFLIILAVCALLYACVFAIGAGKVLSASREVSSARIGVTSQLADGFLHIETVKAFGGEALIARRFDEALAVTQAGWRRFYTVRSLTGLAAGLIFTAGLASVLLMSVRQIGAGTMTPGGLVLVSAYMLQIVRPMEMLGLAARDLGQGAAFIEKLNAFLSEPPDAPENTIQMPAYPAAPLSVSFRQVGVRDPAAGDILRDITLDVPPGSRVGLVGPSGSGKSTLLRLLMGFCTPAHGEILINGISHSDFDPASLRRQIAYIPQTPEIFSGDLAFNASIADPDASSGCLADVLRRVSLDRLRAAHEAGTSLPTSEPPIGLSGGELQRLAIARALLRRPRLVLADEPTSALDPVSESVLLPELERAFAGITQVIASHRLSTIRDADLILVMEKGQIAEQGNHERLMARGGLYARMWRAQTEGHK